MPDFAQPLREEDVARFPWVQFSRWFREAVEAGTRAPEAAALATASEQGIPSVRMVLVKAHEEPGFVFYSNYDSRKGRELAANPHAALLFHWPALGRQVRVEGRVERTGPEESARYVRGRPLRSRLSALASPQSEVIAAREVLETRVVELEERLCGSDPPVPENWGGFRLSPDSFEFWQHREDRLHDRLRYSRQEDGDWLLERLAP